MPDKPPRSDGHNDDRPDPRTGEDTRRRGWYWHWNSIITQYAPLIGLKGVGLLNSYTVWTDRREDSPHRGYAFPSQQAEAAFYGEDRAELITINKILVALDLIEVRKEMVLHVDDQGRRWRVPHNLYRVKDNPNGFNITVEDALRVAELAAKTPAVYRYIRRVFSPNFAPIDSKSPWHDILPAVRQTETWQRLAARAEREDARASARSKAGHQKRKGKGKNQASEHDDSKTAEITQQEVAQFSEAGTFVVNSNEGSGTDVQSANNGSLADVETTNRGLNPKSPTVDGHANEGEETVVHPGNTTYNQDSVNTTRTTTSDDFQQRSTATIESSPPEEDGFGPILQASPSVLAAFQSANDRQPTALERELLGELERDFADAARRADTSPADWTVAAIREAVNSGSRFVAPKRVREILSRWASTSRRGVRTRGAKAALGQEDAEAGSAYRADDLDAVWARIYHNLQKSSEWPALAGVLDGASVLDESDGTVRINVPHPDIPDSMVHYLAETLGTAFSRHLGRDVRAEMIREDDQQQRQQPHDAPREGEDESGNSPASEPGPSAAQPAPRFSVVDGLTNSQVWAAAQEDLRGRMSAANFETWLRPASLIGRDEHGSLVLGVPNRFAQQRVQAKLKDDIEAVLSRIVGGPVTVRIVVGQQWLRENRQP